MVARRIRIGPPGSTASADFIARTVNNTWDAQYTTLIDNLVSSGVWAKLDALWIMCARTEANAILNLVSTSYTLTNNGCTFAADDGFSGDGVSDYIETGLNLSTATQFQRNSSHLSLWVNNSTSAGAPMFGVNTTACASDIWPKYSGDGKAYFRVNDDPANTGSLGGTTSDSIGFYVASRTAASGAGAIKGYKNSSTPLVSASTASVAAINDTVVMLASKTNGTLGPYVDTAQLSAASVGAGLDATDFTSLYTEIGTFRTAVGL